MSKHVWLFVILFVMQPLMASQQSDYDKLVTELRCMVCQNQNLADSNAPMAADLRRFIRRHLAQGQSAHEVRQQLRARYGDYIDFHPAWNQRTWLLWGLPWVLMGGAGCVWWYLSRRGRDD